jgi:hypothetical protein
MNKPFSKTILLLSFTALFACQNTENTDQTKAKNITNAPIQAIAAPKINEDSVILDMRKQVLTTLKNKDLKAFAAFFHPTLGVRFSPYAFVDTTHDLTFKSAAFLTQMGDKKKINWGPYDAGEEDIVMNLNTYFSKFVYNADFLNAEKTSLNEMIGGGTVTNNLTEIYPNCPFTESYFSGFEKKYDGMDWCSLRLVFKKEGDKYYLVGIVHSQWTT